MSTLCNYELQRLETIRKNAEMLTALGIHEAVESLKPQKIKKPRQPKPLPTSKRSSSRLSGDVVAAEGLEQDDDAFDAFRDPNDVSQMLPSELKEWCDALREAAQDAPWTSSLNDEQVQRLRDAQEWLAPFTEFTARFGGKNETTMSRQSMKSVLAQVFKLVSGVGVATKGVDGVFAAGRPITLGVSSEEADALRVEAQLWCPLRTAPADLVGKSTIDGATIEHKPTSTVFDTSNGWLLNHPLMKIRNYCEHLDEVRSKGLAKTMRRLMTGEEGEEGAVDAATDAATTGGGAGKAVSRAAERKVSARVALDDFIVPDGEGEEEAGRGRPRPKHGGKKYRPPPPPKAKSDAQPANEVEGGGAEDDEDAPLAKRRKPAAGSKVLKSQPPPAPSLAFAFEEMQKVECRCGDVWAAAVIDNINEEEGTYDLVFEVGGEEENVAADRIRALSALP